MFYINKKLLTPIVHIIIWLCLFFYPFLFHYIPFDDSRAVLRIAILLLLLMSFFYSNTLILIPKVLGKKKIVLYLLTVLSVIIIISFAVGYIQVFLNPDYEVKPQIFNRAFNTGIITAILTWVISSLIKVTTEWFRNQQMMRYAENEKLNAELNFLKSQVNPHFLFNALNNIYSLENKKSPDTGPAILKLSELIRYMLYETGSEYVQLEREIEYLKNYVELQKLGLSKDVTIDFILEGDFSNKKIKPMLLIPLIENVFKHGISYLNNLPLKISVKVSDVQIEVITENSIIEAGSGLKQNAGIGLVNLRKRLSLLYPEKYEFIISRDNEKFITCLKIIL